MYLFVGNRCTTSHKCLNKCNLLLITWFRELKGKIAQEESHFIAISITRYAFIIGLCLLMLKAYYVVVQLFMISTFDRIILINIFHNYTSPVGRAVEYTDYTTAEGYHPHPRPMSVLDMIQNNLIVRFQRCWSFVECGVPLHCHRSQVHSGPEW